MATYSDLVNVAAKTGTLTDQILAACFVAATGIMGESTATPNHDNRLLWAKNVFASPERERQRMLWAVLGQNASATLSQIQNATDATVQTAVNAAIDLFANGQP